MNFINSLPTDDFTYSKPILFNKGTNISAIPRNKTQHKSRSSIGDNNRKQKNENIFYSKFECSFLMSHSTIITQIYEQEFRVPENIRLIQYTSIGQELKIASILFLYDKINSTFHNGIIPNDHLDHYYVTIKNKTIEAQILKPLLKLQTFEPGSLCKNLFLSYNDEFDEKTINDMFNSKSKLSFKYLSFKYSIPELYKSYIESNSEVNNNINKNLFFEFNFYEKNLKTHKNLNKLFDKSNFDKSNFSKPLRNKTNKITDTIIKDYIPLSNFISKSPIVEQKHKFILGNLLLDLSSYYKYNFPGEIVNIVQIGCKSEQPYSDKEKKDKNNKISYAKFLEKTKNEPRGKLTLSQILEINKEIDDIEKKSNNEFKIATTENLIDKDILFICSDLKNAIVMRDKILNNEIKDRYGINKEINRMINERDEINRLINERDDEMVVEDVV